MLMVSMKVHRLAINSGTMTVEMQDLSTDTLMVYCSDHLLGMMMARNQSVVMGFVRVGNLGKDLGMMSVINLDTRTVFLLVRYLVALMGKSLETSLAICLDARMVFLLVEVKGFYQGCCQVDLLHCKLPPHIMLKDLKFVQDDLFLSIYHNPDQIRIRYS